MAKLLRIAGGVLVLDADGLMKLANGNLVARSYFEDARAVRSDIVTAASALTEVLRGGPKDAPVHRILSKVTVVTINAERARAAGELLGRTGLSGHRCAMDAILATIALEQDRPVLLLTSDTKDLSRLTEEPGRPKHERVAVVRI